MNDQSRRDADTPPPDSYPYGDGAMGALLRETDWAATPLGPLEGWPALLRHAVQMVIAASAPVALLWGEQHISIYNDAYGALLGRLHPHSFGVPVYQAWKRVWDQMSPLLDAVAEGRSVQTKDVAVLANRCGTVREAFFSSSYSPVFDEAGAVVGVLLVASETTERVQSRRRLRAMHELGVQLALARSSRDVLRRAAATLEAYERDVPFALFYGPDITEAVRADSVMARSLPQPEPAADGQVIKLTDVATPPTPPGIGFEALRLTPPTRALALTLYAAPPCPEAVWLVVGLNPYIALESDYRDFLVEVARTIGTVYGATRARELESEARFRAVAEASPDLVAITDAHGQFNFLSSAADEVLGTPADALLGRSLFSLFSPEDDRKLRSTFTALLQQPGARATFLVSRPAASDGEPCWLAGNARNLLNHPGVSGILLSIRDVTDVKHFESELITAREQAEAMSRLKSSLLTNMSHEIRTPLTSIISMGSLLAEEVPPEHREAAAVIARAGLRLNETLSSVLTLAQLEGEALDIELADRDLRAEIDDALRSLRQLAIDKGLTLDFARPDTPIVACVDPTLLSSVLNNLIGNAIKFTPTGEITVCLSADEHRAILRVEDTGIGIGRDFLPRLFDEFQQESTGIARQHQGTGLGLALARRMITVMDGTISVVSTRGAGTTFTVTFPRPARHDAPPPSIADMSARQREAALDAASLASTIELPDVDAPLADVAPLPAPGAATAGATATDPAERPTVLLIEDDDMIRVAVERLLRRRFTVTSAVDAESGIERALFEDFAIVLLDIGLPGMSGVEAMRQIRAIPDYEERPIVALTGYAMPDDRRRFLAEGFSEYLAKPFAPRELLALLERLV